MQGEQISQASPIIYNPRAGLPLEIVSFLELCLLAGVLNDIAVMALLVLHHHPAMPDAGHAMAALVMAAILFPFAALPYWLALAVVYVRNEWAWRILYGGAAMCALATLLVIGKHGLFSPQALCMLGATGAEVAALIYLGKPPARAWLHSTVPGFTVVAPGS